MDSIGEEVRGVSVDDVVKPLETFTEVDNADRKVTYKSFKKKYKKLKMKFDEAMRVNNKSYVDEQKGLETAKRLAIENDRLLDILLDVNDSAQIPLDKRIDLSVESPSLTAIPSLLSQDELARAAAVNTPEGQAINKEICAMIDEKNRAKSAPRPPKSLAQLMATTPHLTTRTTNPEYHAARAGDGSFSVYLTPDQIDEYLFEVEEVPSTPPVRRHQSDPHHDLAFRNPQSVNSWLRKHHPELYQQDAEGSDKSKIKPGSLRGAGKRASMPVPSRPDALEIVEEDGIGYDPTIAGLEASYATKGKRKREDDGGYHPKLGAPDGKIKKPRPKKKKVEGEPPAKKSRAKPRISGDSMVVDEPPSSLPPTV